MVTEHDAVTGAVLARNPYNTEYAGARGVRLRQRDAALGHRRPGFVPRPQRLARAAGGPRPRRRSRAASARASTPAPRCRCRSTLAPGETRRLVVPAGPGERHRGGARPRLAPRLEWRQPTRRSRGRRRRAGTARSGRCRCATPDDSFDLLMNRWLLYQDLSCRLWARSGLLPARRRLRLPRPAPGHDGAHASRGPSSPASTCCAPPLASSWRATSSTGGTSRAAAARGRGARTTCCGCPTRRRTTCERDRRHGGARRGVAFLDAPALAPRRRRRPTSSRERPTERASLFEHCVRAIEKGLTSERTGCR